MAASLVSSSRFKLIDVSRRVSIREFTAANGLDFAAGKGFYELMKPELIQDYKEIVVVRRSDGSKVTGAKVRELLGVSPSATKFRLDTDKLSDFKVFVQSTSYNRVLVPGTQFLYEVGDGDDGADGGNGSGIVLTDNRPPAPPSGAGMPIEIVLSFDTTCSMSSALQAVRERLQELIERLHRDIPGIRIAVFAHGDYASAKSSYLTKHIDFTTDVQALCEFVRDAGPTNGGDWEECYELVLKEAREMLSWTPGTQRALVMIGDAGPHEPADYRKCSLLRKYPRIVWKDEVDAIVRVTGCRVYAVQCLDRSEATAFWKYLAYHTHGYHVNLNNFSSVLDFIMAICYREQGAEQLQAYRAEVEERTRSDGGMNTELRRLFETLGASTAGGAPPPTNGSASVVIASPSVATSAAKEAAADIATCSPSAGPKRKAGIKLAAAAAKRARPSDAAKNAVSPSTLRREGVVTRGAAAAAAKPVGKRESATSPKTGGTGKGPARASTAGTSGAAAGKAKRVKGKASQGHSEAKRVKGTAKGAPRQVQPAAARWPTRAAAAEATSAANNKKAPPKRKPT